METTATGAAVEALAVVHAHTSAVIGYAPAHHAPDRKATAVGIAAAMASLHGVLDVGSAVVVCTRRSATCVVRAHAAWTLHCALTAPFVVRRSIHGAVRPATVEYRDSVGDAALEALARLCAGIVAAHALPADFPEHITATPKDGPPRVDPLPAWQCVVERLATLIPADPARLDALSMLPGPPPLSPGLPDTAPLAPGWVLVRVRREDTIPRLAAHTVPHDVARWVAYVAALWYTPPAPPPPSSTPTDSPGGGGIAAWFGRAVSALGGGNANHTDASAHRGPVASSPDPGPRGANTLELPTGSIAFATFSDPHTDWVLATVASSSPTLPLLAEARMQAVSSSADGPMAFDAAHPPEPCTAPRAVHHVRAARAECCAVYTAAAPRVWVARERALGRGLVVEGGGGSLASVVDDLMRLPPPPAPSSALDEDHLDENAGFSRPDSPRSDVDPSVAWPPPTPLLQTT